MRSVRLQAETSCHHVTRTRGNCGYTSNQYTLQPLPTPTDRCSSTAHCVCLLIIQVAAAEVILVFNLHSMDEGQQHCTD
jgi:hypothetical protein